MKKGTSLIFADKISDVPFFLTAELISQTTQLVLGAFDDGSQVRQIAPQLGHLRPQFPQLP